MKQKLVRFLQTRFINPAIRGRAGGPGYRYALLETKGRKTGKRRQTPVANGLQGSVFWIVSEYGPAAYYVRNLVADPQVRIRVDGAWRTGTAHVMHDEDPNRHLKALDPRTAAEIRRMGSQLLTVRVDLDALAA